MCCACQHDVSTKFNILLHASFNQLLLNMMQSLDEELCTVSCQKHGTKPKFSNKSVRTSPFFLMCSPSLHCLFAFPAKKHMEVKIQQVNWVAKTVSQTRKLNPFRVKGGATQFTFAVTKKKKVQTSPFKEKCAVLASTAGCSCSARPIRLSLFLPLSLNKVGF